MAREELKAFRRSKGLTQPEMAKKLEISLSHYKALESGQQDPSFMLLYRFGKAFEDGYDDIWNLFGRK